MAVVFRTLIYLRFPGETQIGYTVTKQINGRKEHEIGKKEEKENLSSEHGNTDHHSPLLSRASQH